MYFSKNDDFFGTCAMYSELPTNISTMGKREAEKQKPKEKEIKKENANEKEGEKERFYVVYNCQQVLQTL